MKRLIDKELMKPSIFGMFDGLTSLLGVLIPLLASAHMLLFVTCLGLSVSSAISMGLGEYLSSDKTLPKKKRLRSSIYMGIFTGIGCFLPVVPYFFVGGTLALTLFILIYLLLTLVVAAMKSRDLGWKDALIQTFLVSVVAVVVVVAATIGLPSNGG